MKQSELMKLTWWDKDRIVRGGEKLISSLKGHVSSAYFAPIEAKDARRMRHIAELLSKPFVVHFWDFLDGNMEEESTKWLIRNAERVFCLNQAMAHDVKRFRDVDILEFTRSVPNFQSRYLAKGEIRVALVGSLGPYMDGVKKLLGAVEILNKAGRSARIVYLNKNHIGKRFFGSYRDHISRTGYIKNDDNKDRILSNCNIAFMPGPSAPPEHDSWSRYSMPSRILDFLGVGLPMVGTVHPRSATYDFCRRLNVHEYLLCEDPLRIADALVALSDSATRRHCG